MGEVYKAEDPALLRTVAIKVVSRSQAEKSDAQMRFLREARAASAINHPNIVTIYEIGETDEQAYIVMEYVDGLSLRDLIRSRDNPERIADIALQICDALEEAHSRRVIHRDIKPENILVSHRGQVKVVDFGLAKGVGMTRRGGATDIQNLTDSGTVMGTLSYMSPEQLRGEELDEGTDIFSFGLVLYELLTGRLPFAGDTPFEVAAAILKDSASPVDNLPAGVPLGIERVVERLLEKEREKRFRSFADVRREIRALVKPAGESNRTIELPSGQSPRDFGPRPRSDVPTLLVLPLETVGEEDDSYIGVGLAHAITTDLAKIGGLSVLSKSVGAGRVGEGSRDDRELARELGATIILEGEVVKSGATIGVMARLTDVESGRVIWGSQYRGDATDLFSIQDAVCESVAAALQVSVSKSVRTEIERPLTKNIEAFELYSKGRAFLERRDVAENIDYAIQVFLEALSLDSDFALAHAGLGEAYWRKYQATKDSSWVDRAIAATDHALVLDPVEPRVHLALGIIYHGTGKIEQAREQFERVVELQPFSDEAHKWLGRCSLRRGEMEPAITHFRKAIEIRPGYWENYSALGACYASFGRYREAAEQFRRAITFQPDNFLGYDDLGGMYYMLGQFEDAARMYRRAIQIYPNHRSYSNLGTACFYLGQYDEAIEAYRSAIELNPRDERHRANLGDLYWRLNRHREAGNEYAIACELLDAQLLVNPEDAKRLGLLAVCQAKLGRRDEAAANADRAVELEERNATVLYQKSVVCALCGQPDNAVAWLRKALGLGYSRYEAGRDPDLDSLHEREDYKALLEKDITKSLN
jgi:serine/threonine protein kinase/tetratricopeptide (TPR) repeat protein